MDLECANERSNIVFSFSFKINVCFDIQRQNGLQGHKLLLSLDDLYTCVCVCVYV